MMFQKIGIVAVLFTQCSLGSSSGAVSDADDWFYTKNDLNQSVLKFRCKHCARKGFTTPIDPTWQKSGKYLFCPSAPTSPCRKNHPGPNTVKNPADGKNDWEMSGDFLYLNVPELSSKDQLEAWKHKYDALQKAICNAMAFQKAVLVADLEKESHAASAQILVHKKLADAQILIRKNFADEIKKLQKHYSHLTQDQKSKCDAELVRIGELLLKENDTASAKKEDLTDAQKEDENVMERHEKQRRKNFVTFRGRILGEFQKLIKKCKLMAHETKTKQVLKRREDFRKRNANKIIYHVNKKRRTSN